LLEFELVAGCTVVRMSTVQNTVPLGSTLTRNEKAGYPTHKARLPEEHDPIVTRCPIPDAHGRVDAEWVWRHHADTSEPLPEPRVFQSLRPDGETTEAVR
jgi:hypothetical protein